MPRRVRPYDVVQKMHAEIDQLPFPFDLSDQWFEAAVEPFGNIIGGQMQIRYRVRVVERRSQIRIRKYLLLI